MADRWMDERDRMMRDRDWRRSEAYGRGPGRRYEGGEDRSFGGGSDDDDQAYYGARGSGSDRDRVFGERESGLSYGGQGYDSRERGDTSGMRPGGGSYGAGGRYGAGEGYRGGGREARRPAWQDPNYQGVSPAMQQDEYDLERRAERYQDRHGGQHAQQGGQGRNYEQGGRYLGDDRREPIYREEWSQGRRDYGPAPRGYDADAEDRRRDHRRGRFEEGYDSRMFAGGDRSGGMASGGTGGYDYERGYGDGGRGDEGRRDRGWRGEEGRDRDRDRGERFEQAGHEAGDWFRRAGERVASWFGGDNGGQGGRADRDRYGADYSRHRGFQGMGPKGYQRPDERIDEEAHERLTDDSWLDASNISVSVSGGEVTLSGTVENREAKHRAERIVEDVSGVRHVQNNLRVQEGSVLTSPSKGYGDSVLEAQMREAGTNKSGDSATTNGGSPTRSSGAGSTITDAGKSR